MVGVAAAGSSAPEPFINLSRPPPSLDGPTVAVLAQLNLFPEINRSGHGAILTASAVRAGLDNPYVTLLGKQALMRAATLLGVQPVVAGGAASLGQAAAGSIAAGAGAALGLPPERAAVRDELARRGVPVFAHPYPTELAVPAELAVLRLPFEPGTAVFCQQGNNTMADETSHAPYQLRYALDFATPDAAQGGGREGLALLAPAGGVAYVYDRGRVNKPDNWGFGKMILIDHGNGYASLLAHLASTSVKTGERVEAGQLVGAVGTTGSAGNAHLHFQVVRLLRTPAPAREQHQAEFGRPAGIEPPFGETVPFRMEVAGPSGKTTLASTEFCGAEALALPSRGATYVAP